MNWNPGRQTLKLALEFSVSSARGGMADTPDLGNKKSQFQRVPSGFTKHLKCIAIIMQNSNFAINHKRSFAKAILSQKV
jgi:hypothetical protein